MNEFWKKLNLRLEDFIISLISFKVGVFCVITYLFRTTDKIDAYIYIGAVLAILGIRAWKDDGAPSKKETNVVKNLVDEIIDIDKVGN